MKQFLYRLTLNRADMLSTGPTPAEAEAVAAHVAYLEAQAVQGTVLMAGRTQTEGADAFGMVILCAPDMAAATEFMRADPAVAAGVMAAKLYPYRIAVLGDAIALGD